MDIAMSPTRASNPDVNPFAPPPQLEFAYRAHSDREKSYCRFNAKFSDTLVGIYFDSPGKIMRLLISGSVGI
jgi:hypothetical protein